MDSYRAIYDATAQAFGSAGDVTLRAAQAVEYEMTRPSVLYRPSVMPDGNKWCALYGENLMEGVCGFGDTPDLAMRDFDNNWWKEKTPVAVRMEKEAPATPPDHRED